MPAVQPPAKVLVSGANGYIAIWVIRTLLEKGYAVRGTVRSADKGEHLKEMFKSYGDRHEIFVVEDITKEGAFDEAVKGVDAIEHTASPLPGSTPSDDPEIMIRPAVDGTVGILHSALKYGFSVKRIVMTSSCAAVIHNSPTSPPSPQVFSEVNWNEEAPLLIQQQGKDAPPMQKYRASKTLAERAAWAFVESHKGEIMWDLVVLNPPFVFGPPIQSILTPSALNLTAGDWYRTVLTLTPTVTNPAKLTMGNSWVDVRDLAEAHTRALEREEAGGERVIVSGGTFLWQDFINIVNAFPKETLAGLANPSSIPTGTPARDSTHPDARHLFSYDTAKAVRILGMSPANANADVNTNEEGEGEKGYTPYRGLEECARGMVAEFVRRGW